MGQLSQANYPAALKTPLGDDVLVLRSFSGNEVLGQPFEFHIDALSEQENIKMICMLNAVAARVGADLPPGPHLRALSEEAEPERLVR